jgi:choline dehydrogenase-like flavoprotein
LPLLPAAALDADYDVCVVGAGPAGLACGFSCHDQGLRVLMLEAGGARPAARAPDILAAEVADPKWHDPVDLVSACALGGTSHWWGGRAVPLDPVDFDAWPVRHDEMSPWYDAAADFLGVRSAHISPPPGAYARLTRFDASRDETWTRQTNIARRWDARIVAPQGPAIVLNARVVGMIHEAGRIEALRVRVGGEERLVRARRFVLACGGLGGLRLMLLTQRDHPALFGGPDGPLGRSYMGHLTGVIADLAPADIRDVEQFCFRPLAADLFARRQIHARAETVREHRIGQVAFWLDSPANDDPARRAALASAKYVFVRALRQLSLAAPNDAGPLWPHFASIARAPVSTAADLARLAGRHAFARVTGKLPQLHPLVHALNGGWRMHYHAEQRPDRANRVRLSETLTDSIGLPRLRIEFRFSDEDVESVVRAHELLDADLIEAGAGRLRWRAARDECVAIVRAGARDGYHQLGGAAMAASARDGVVDSECRAFGLENLWVASSSVFPTGGQANPTLTVVALACRVADRLARPNAQAA